MEIAQDDELVILTQKSNDSDIEILTQRIINQTSQEYKVNSSFGLLSQNSEYSIPCQQSPNPPSTKESDPEILTQKSDDSIPCQQEQSYMMESPVAGKSKPFKTLFEANFDEFNRCMYFEIFFLMGHISMT